MNRIKNILTIAKNTYRETVRDKVFYSIFAFGLIFVIFTLFLGSISLGEDVHVVRSIGLAGIYFCTLIITVFLGASLLSKEIEGQTLYFVLSKPITHGEFVIGKFLGLLASVTVSLFGMTFTYLAIVAYAGGGFDRFSLLAILYQIVEMAFLIAILIFYSTFSTPIASTIYAILTAYIGHSLGMLTAFLASLHGFLHAILISLYYLLPNLEKFNIRDLILYGSHPSLSEILFVILYGTLYCSLLLFFSKIMLKKREM